MRYNPSIFDVSSLDEAKKVILTEEDGLTSDDRWRLELPFVRKLLKQLQLTDGSYVIDHGCGVGRVSRELIDLGCNVLGVDISKPMLLLAGEYVNSSHFASIHPSVLYSNRTPRFDAVTSVWVLQHCLRPDLDIEYLYDLMKPGARMLIVNNLNRAVPVLPDQPLPGQVNAWGNDGLDIRSMMREQFSIVAEGEIPEALGHTLHELTFWGVYQK